MTASPEGLGVGIDQNALIGIRNMAGANLIARFESKLDSRSTQAESLRAEISSLRRMTGVGFTLLALLVTLLRLLE
ncbi:MAG: hypothetical protein OXN89_13670 [Bryobacterales bacterium]|nr:hypothetical protein [Bryobacterales bacterium]